MQVCNADWSIYLSMYICMLYAGRWMRLWIVWLGVQLGVHVCIYDGRLTGIWVNEYRSVGLWMGMYACMYVVE